MRMVLTEWRRHGLRVKGLIYDAEIISSSFCYINPQIIKYELLKKNKRAINAVIKYIIIISGNFPRQISNYSINVEYNLRIIMRTPAFAERFYSARAGHVQNPNIGDGNGVDTCSVVI